MKSEKQWLVFVRIAFLSLGLFWDTYGSLQAAAEKTVSGRSGVAVQRAVINFSDLAEKEAVSSAAPEAPMVAPFPLPPGWLTSSTGKVSSAQSTSPLGGSPAAPTPDSPAPTASFLALGDNGRVIPPDTHGAVGPNHLMVTLNSQVRIQSKSGTPISTVSLATFWASLNTTDNFDPKVIYDHLAGRWIFTSCAQRRSANSSVLLAVSATSDPTGNWFLYKTDGDSTDLLWVDYPNIGYNKDWIIVTENMFTIADDTFTKANVFVFNKSDFYANGPGTFTLLSTSNAFTLAPATTFDDTLSTMYLVEMFDQISGKLAISTVTGPVGSEVLTMNVATPVVGSPWSFGVGTNFAPQLGSSERIGNNDARMQSVVYRNGSIWCAHTVFLPAISPTHTAIQWCQLTPSGMVQQSARIEDPSGQQFFAFPSIAVNRNNDVLIGYSRYSASQYASANYSFRAGDDSPDTLRPDTVLKAGEAPYYKTFGGTRNRWGDYSATVVDPVNDFDMWTIQEYAATPFGGADRWGTWWGRIAPEITTGLFVHSTIITGGNGNGLIDFSECNSLNVVLTNRGLDSMTGIQVRLSTTTPGVIISQSFSLYSDMPGFSTRTNLTPFQISTGPNFICGTPISFIAVIKSDQETKTNLFSVLSSTNCVNGGGTCPGANLAIGLKALPSPVVLGNNLTYTITVTNPGPSAAPGTLVNQSLPGSVVFVSANSSQGTVTHSAGTIIGNLGTLGIGASATITVVVSPAAAPASLVSTATVSSSEPDIDSSNNSVTVTTQVNPPSADLYALITDSPDPVLAGALLTYRVAVTNNGPSTATGVFLTNTLPSIAGFISASVSQGNYSTNASGAIICTFGTLPSGAGATVTIVVRPAAAGVITATSTVTANQLDSVPGNNTVSASTTVSPAADLAVSIIDTPDPVVERSNVTYIVTVTNRGPSAATSVFLSHNLPAFVNLISATVTQGSTNGAGSVITWDIGSLSSGSSATLTVVLATTKSGNLNTSANISLNEMDPDTSNNTASATTSVASPFVSIVAAGSTLVSENLFPTNGAVDFGERVTVNFGLRNVGNVSSTNLVATLQTSGGVSLPTGPQTYGVLQAGGVPVTRPFSFTVPSSGSSVTASLQLQDGLTNLGTVTFVLNLPSVTTFTNPASIEIPTNGLSIGKAKPYPSAITVSNLNGFVSDVTVTLSNMSHTFPKDVDMLLVGPAGQSVVLMSDASSVSLVGGSFTLTDAATSFLPEDDVIESPNYRPTDYDTFGPDEPFPAPAPAEPYGSTLSVFDGTNPNGVWSLYIVDDEGGDRGDIIGGWRLSITTIMPVNKVADLALMASASTNTLFVGDSLSYTFTITNKGPDTAIGSAFTNFYPGSLSIVSAVSPQGICLVNSNNVICSLGDLAPGTNATVTIVATAIAAGSISNSASVRSIEGDLNLADNSATAVVTANAPPVDLAIGLIDSPDPVTVGSNLTYTVNITNNSLRVAAGVVVTNVLPASVISPLVTLSQGSSLSNGSSIRWNVGILSAGGTAQMTIVVTPTVATGINDIANVVTVANDTNSANNSASAATTVINPSPKMVAANAKLISESFVPTNGIIDPGETVTIGFALANTGAASTANLVGTLAASGGVSSPSGSQSYGALTPGGPSVSRSFNFTANGPGGGALTATLQLQDGSNPLSPVTFTFMLSALTVVSNTTPLIIPEEGTANVYPSIINISGLTGLVSKVSVTLYGMSHSFPDDLDILLVSPAGQKILLMSDAGGGPSITNLTLPFNDSAISSLPDAALIMPGAYKPTDYEIGDLFPLPAPAGPSETVMAGFNGIVPNGPWSLYVVDDAGGDSGTIAGGWMLSIVSGVAVNPIVPRFVSFSLLGNGYFEFTVSGQANKTYIIEGSTDLVNWTQLGTGTAGVGGMFQFTDSNAPGFGRRYYRAVSAP